MAHLFRLKESCIEPRLWSRSPRGKGQFKGAHVPVWHKIYELCKGWCMAMMQPFAKLYLFFLNISLFVSLRVHVNDAVKFRYCFDIH